MAGGELPDVGVQRVPAEPQEPPQARPRRIVTIADLKGHQQQSSEPSTAASEATGAPSALTGTRWSEDGRSEEAGSPRPATPDELREYVVGLLERHPATSRQRLLLDLLLEDLGEAPVAPGRVPLPIRLTVIMAHRLGYSVEATAQQVFGDGSQKARRSVEEILAKGVDFELLERLFELAERA